VTSDAHPVTPPGIRRYHEASKHSPESVRTAGRELDWANKPYPYKDYRTGLRPVGLPMEKTSLGVSALDATAGLGPATSRALDRALVGHLLNYGAGVIRKRPVSETQAMYFRTYASAGGLYPVEVYAVAGDLPGLGAGLYHYHPRRHELVTLREGDHRGTLAEATAREPAVAVAPLVLALTGIPWRTAWKYGPRGFRHLYWDAGMILANLLALCSAAGLPARVVAGFDDGAVEQLLGIDGAQEVPLCLVAIGSGAPVPPPLPAGTLSIPFRPLSADEVAYPETVAAQDSGRIEAGAVAAWRSRAHGTGPGSSPKPGSSLKPGSAPEPGDLLEAVIRRRGSARSFDREPMPGTALATILDRATAGVPTDWAAEGSRLVDPCLIANRVEGLDPGAYLYDQAFTLLAEGDFARLAAYLCLEQRLGHDAAATHFLMVDLEGVLGALGERGYRAAELEAGIVGGRMYLAAEAFSLGASGLTFYDADVTEFFGGGRSCMLAVALGPATRRLLPLA
jgi:SagB-type dehydrogenase family enzyme